MNRINNETIKEGNMYPCRFWFIDQHNYNNDGSQKNFGNHYCGNYTNGNEQGYHNTHYRSNSSTFNNNNSNNRNNINWGQRSYDPDSVNVLKKTNPLRDVSRDYLGIAVFVAK